MSNKAKYVLYDGNCSFCISIMQWSSSLMRTENILFYPFESLVGKELISTSNIKDLNSVIYINNGKILYKSSAVLNICKHLKKPYKYCCLFRFFPSYILDFGYDFIAKRRKCRI